MIYISIWIPSLPNGVVQGSFEDMPWWLPNCIEYAHGLDMHMVRWTGSLHLNHQFWSNCCDHLHHRRMICNVRHWHVCLSSWKITKLFPLSIWIDEFYFIFLWIMRAFFQHQETIQTNYDKMFGIIQIWYTGQLFRIYNFKWSLSKSRMSSIFCWFCARKMSIRMRQDYVYGKGEYSKTWQK